ncbi:MAG: hypothetical protein A3D74_00700 [Candidatus Levybacteria bacterium RIFCSPHIGHO2_02_FULL_37_13]|nr:MAG: hypothetical protein A3D74_00700 [Candidatus Levybacteria bacterium RIFCSPHIGHO2_02_FULL_37_13]OGH30734.1 MAG: hypothetical protein A3E40_00730 [Candidatus Levybacteria bacterium RIFCSPHIGHO2_12_FULL_37_9]OGH37939.1 MAG: hypothetical protein A3B41_04995 [Candidatus Levybacteria bacterium RIFCSPLOWO2_01_FULL_37_26]
MKRNLFAFLLMLFAITSLFGSIAYGNEASQTAHIQYNLAYPGILPDNPLYKLKQLRDKITNFLISDPKKKVEFYLLQADKGILATAMLIDKENIALAEQTALKAEHNMTLLNNEFPKMPKKPDNSLFEKLKTASLKHQEVLNSLIERVSKDKQKTFVTVLDFSKRNLQTLEKYAKKTPLRWNMLDNP